ncbi:GPP34 family phosphoprotein [Actinoplanes sp. ATCC 53533]|uniref:GOLPH3/VPS74 family protein n=1 Tax=Actinoplanes sp. ATCC 53533 TaxID=1288362 RepID=UPI000F79B99E|nr:GPP34 family phosphoprotein [Actinoplanes sp. ATCC 53533]RSM39131.1 GPP34 family phosphoprotein [Actinoplanes sp. ATCC 53533]
MNLAEEFALLAYGDDGAPDTDNVRLDNGVGGSLLLELAISGRVGVEDKKVVVRDGTPTGDPLVDQALGRIAADEKPRRPAHWVKKFAKDTRKLALNRLVEQGVLTRQEDTVLLVFPRTRYPAPDGLEPVPETEARQRLIAAVSGSGPVEPRTAALCALLAATNLDRKVFRTLDRGRVKARLAEISAGDWAATAVKQTIEEIQTAVVVAVLAASTVSAATT